MLDRLGATDCNLALRGRLVKGGGAREAGRPKRRKHRKGVERAGLGERQEWGGGGSP